VSLTAGPAFGYGRPPSLDIVTSAWLDSIISVSSQVIIINFVSSIFIINIIIIMILNIILIIILII
jgi:hypothetical protein